MRKNQIIICLCLGIFMLLHNKNYAAFDNNLARFVGSRTSNSPNATNYTFVNRFNFVVNSNINSDLIDYHYSILRLGDSLPSFAGFAGTPYNLGTTPTNILGKFTAYRIEYTNDISFGKYLGLFDVLHTKL